MCFAQLSLLLNNGAKPQETTQGPRWYSGRTRRNVIYSQKYVPKRSHFESGQGQFFWVSLKLSPLLITALNPHTPCFFQKSQDTPRNFYVPQCPVFWNVIARPLPSPVPPHGQTPSSPRHHLHNPPATTCTNVTHWDARHPLEARQAG